MLVRKIRLELVLFLLCFALSLSAEEMEEYDAGNALIKDIQTELNMVRSNPKEYASSILTPRLQRFNGNNYVDEEGKTIETKEGIQAFRECIEVLENTKPLGKLYMEKGLCLAAQFLADDHAKNSSTGHTASDGSTPQIRMERYGFLNGGGENWICGSATARDIVIFLLVDDGVPSRGHRKNILNKDFRKVGIGFSSEHPVYKTACAMNFAVDYVSDRSLSLKNIKGQFEDEKLLLGYEDVGDFIKELQKEINALRSDPSLYASTYIEPLISRFDGNSRLNYTDSLISTKEGIKAIKECVEVLKNTEVLPLISLEKGLCLSAQELADDLEKTGKRGGTTSSGKGAAQRMQEYGRVMQIWSESVWYSLNTARDIVVSMLIDDGVAKRGHRTSILNPRFTKMGIGFSSKHKVYGTVSVIDLCGDYESF